MVLPSCSQLTSSGSCIWPLAALSRPSPRAVRSAPRCSRYVGWLGDAVSLDFGRSYRSEEKMTTLIATRGRTFSGRQDPMDNAFHLFLDIYPAGLRATLLSG